MDKYEYRIRAEEINALIEKKQFGEAAKIADTIDWRRVKSVTMLCKVSELYKISRRYEDSRDILLLAYDRQPGSRKIVYSLCELSIKLEELVPALEYYKEFVQIAPRDTGRFILQYRLYEAQDVSLEERIAVLEEYKKRDYREKWAYELAYLYHRIGLATRCVEECDELILWFGEGKYVIKAMELKMLHAPLTQSQQEKYDKRFEQKLTTDIPETDSYPEEENAQYPEEQTVSRETPEEIPEESPEEQEKPREKLSVTTDTIPDMPIQIRSVDVSNAPTQRMPSKNPQAEMNADESYPVEEYYNEDLYYEQNVPGVSAEESYESGYHRDDAYDDVPAEEGELSIDLPEVPVEEVPEDLDIHVKTLDMGRFNTMDLQKELAQNLADLMQQEDMEANDATKAIPITAIDAALASEEPTVPEMPVEPEYVEPVNEEAIPTELEFAESEPVEPVYEEDIQADPEYNEPVSEEAIPTEPEFAESEPIEPVYEGDIQAEPEYIEPVSEEEIPAEAESDMPESEVEEADDGVEELTDIEENIEDTKDLNALAEEALAQMQMNETPIEDQPTKQWNPEKINEVITTEDVEEVVKTIGAPVHSTITEDDLLRSLNKMPESDEEPDEEAVEEAVEELSEEPVAEEVPAEEAPIAEEELQFIPINHGLNFPGAPLEDEDFEDAQDEMPIEAEATETEEPETSNDSGSFVEDDGQMTLGEPEPPSVSVITSEDKAAVEASDLPDAEKENIQEQITGQLSFQDLMADWEETRRANEEKHIEEMRQQILKQTGPLMADYVNKDNNDLNVIAPTLNVFEVKPRPDEKVFRIEDVDEEPETKPSSSLMNTAEINGLEEKLISSFNENSETLDMLKEDEEIAKVTEEARNSIESEIGAGGFTGEIVSAIMEKDEEEGINSPSDPGFNTGSLMTSIQEKTETGDVAETEDKVSDTAELEQLVSEAIADEETETEEPETTESTAPQPERPASIYDALRPKNERGNAATEQRPASIYDALRPKNDTASENEPAQKPASIYDALKPKSEQETPAEEIKEDIAENIEEPVEAAAATPEAPEMLPVEDEQPVSGTKRMSTAEIKDVLEYAEHESYKPTSAAEAVAQMKSMQSGGKPKANTQDLVNALGNFDISNTKPPVNGNTGFIIEDLTEKPLEDLATEQPKMKEPVPLGPNGKRYLSKEEKEVFSDIATTSGIQEQLVDTIDNMSLKPAKGNIIITGEKGTGTLDTAKKLIKILSATRPGFSGKVAKISGDLLNSKGVPDTMNNVAGGALIIEEAGSMNDITLYAINDYINNPSSPDALIILEDTKKDIDLLFSNPAAPKDSFDLEVDIETLDNNGLVNFGKEYANEQDFSIDEMGTLALYTRISEMQTNTHSVTVDEVREIIDEAIRNSQKRNVGHFMDVIFSKRYDNNDMVVLKEKDFLK